MRKKGIIFIPLLLLIVAIPYFVFKDEAQAPEQTTTTTTTIVEVNPELFELSLEKIFTKTPDADLSKIRPEDLTTLIMTGDIIPARHVNAKVIGYGDFNHPYLKTADFLNQADLTVSNLESPLIAACPTVSDGMTFCGDPRHVEGLKFAGIDIVSLANNHAGNYGESGLVETHQYLAQAGIESVGNGRTVIREIKGVKFAFLAYNGILEHFDLDQIRSDIADAKKEANVIIVMPHWGKEYVRIPEISPGIAPEDPREIGQALIDLGADLVLGNHPHWYQGVEIYKNKLISYAHGNFVFDQEWSLETKQGVVGKYTFYKGRLVGVNFAPIQIEDYNQPFFLDSTAAEKTIAEMKANSFE